jgi:1,4-alpha-glucan branching enzyme
MNAHVPVGTGLDAADVAGLQNATHGDPFKVLGPHTVDTRDIIRAYYPGASSVDVVIEGRDPLPMIPTHDGLFEIAVGARGAYRLAVHWPGGTVETADPYSFSPILTDFELSLIAEGRYFDLPTRLGANIRDIDGVNGVFFAVWAPNAHNVSVVGDFNSWDPRRHPMRLRHHGGIWELFVPTLGPGEIYKFAIKTPDGSLLPFKADPMAKIAELPPRTGSIVAPPWQVTWTDDEWLQTRAGRQSLEAPISCYEVHVGSWLKTHDQHFGTWDEAVDRLIPYCQHLGFTHIELMPIAEHPFGGSWGYQPLALFAPTSRLGSPESFARFVDKCHAANIGVLLDWVPAHFPGDAHGMVRFDGTALYEHEDPRQGYHPDWNTMIYNVGRSEVRGFLIASALWWLRHFHIDGLRVDAVASMLYRDYSRQGDAWVPNIYGGRENLESEAFLKELNGAVRHYVPGAIMIAEESTAWPGITSMDGLGFHFKWNMGWMHDTLHYCERDPIYRKHHLNEITFGLLYGFSEAFILSLSHDEVVHGKKSLIGKMPGDDWQRFANLRLLLAEMWTHPGKKLLFMGCEFGAEQEWNVDAPFPWPHPYDEKRQGLMRMVSDLNALYRSYGQLHRLDRYPEGFEWVVANDTDNAVFAFRRSDGDRMHDLLIVFNSTPVPRYDYRIGVPVGGKWAEIFNSDSSRYAGSDLGNGGGVEAWHTPNHGQDHTLSLVIPPLGLIILEPRGYDWQ